MASFLAENSISFNPKTSLLETIVNNATKFQNLASVVNIPSSLRSTETHRTLIFSLQDPDSVAESFLHQIYSLPESL
ncbi:hypothetical protein BB560_005429, partial [Smittium megazygosporum]